MFLDDTFAEDDEVREMIGHRLKQKERERYLVDALDSFSNENAEDADLINPQIKTPFDEDINEMLEAISRKINRGCSNLLELKAGLKIFYNKQR